VIGSVAISRRALFRSVPPATIDRMMVDIQTTIAFVLIGSAAVAAGVVGMRLPPGDRISASLALVVGAGVGVVSLAIGTDISDNSSEGVETVFLVASALGFVATLASLALLWRWTERRRRAERPSEAPRPT
jgi:peptidoglycan/LPS O-acetylase OafA/YrhL